MSQYPTDYAHHQRVRAEIAAFLAAASRDWTALAEQLLPQIEPVASLAERKVYTAWIKFTCHTARGHLQRQLGRAHPELATAQQALDDRATAVIANASEIDAGDRTTPPPGKLGQPPKPRRTETPETIHWQAQLPRFNGLGPADPHPKRITAVALQAATFLGLGDGEIRLLDALCSFSQPKDWEAGRVPLIGATNLELERRLGWEQRKVQRGLLALRIAGLIAGPSNPSGHRRIVRGDDGHIVPDKSSGITLALLAVRHAEFVAMIAESRGVLAERRALNRQIGIHFAAVHNVAGAVEVAGHTDQAAGFQSLVDRADALMHGHSIRQPIAELHERLLGMASLAAQIETFWNSLPQAGFKPENMSSTDDIHDAPYRTTDSSEDLCRTEAKQQARNRGPDLSQPKPSPETWNNYPKDCSDLGDPEIASIALPELGWPEADNENGTRGDFVAAVRQQARRYEISQSLLDEAIAVLGFTGLIIAFVYIVDKRRNGQCHSPGGYLRFMINRYTAGKLDLRANFNALRRKRDLQPVGERLASDSAIRRRDRTATRSLPSRQETGADSTASDLQRAHRAWEETA